MARSPRLGTKRNESGNLGRMRLPCQAGRAEKIVKYTSIWNLVALADPLASDLPACQLGDVIGCCGLGRRHRLLLDRRTILLAPRCEPPVTAVTASHQDAVVPLPCLAPAVPSTRAHSVPRTTKKQQHLFTVHRSPISLLAIAAQHLQNLELYSNRTSCGSNRGHITSSRNWSTPYQPLTAGFPSNDHTSPKASKAAPFPPR